MAEAEEQTNFEATKADVLAELKGRDLELMKSAILLIEANNTDIEDAMSMLGDENQALQITVLKTLARDAWKVVMNYAGFAVALGQKMGTIDGDGDPTATMPPELATALAGINEELAKFKDAYVEFVEVSDGEA